MLGVGASKKTYLDEVFSTYLYKGSSGGKTINNAIDLSTEGGLVWAKRRDGGHEHGLYDTIRGVEKRLSSDSTAAEEAASTGLKTFTTTGFTCGSADDIGGNGDSYTSWTFRKAPGFFDVVTYTGSGSAQNISHSLGSIPGMIMVKRTSYAEQWVVYHRDLGTGKFLALNTSDAHGTDGDGAIWGQTAPTSTQFTVGTHGMINGNGSTYIAYVFAGGESTAATARSVDFDGSGDYLEIADHADFDLGNSNFTVECWVKGIADGSNRNIVGQWSSGNKSWSVFWGAANQYHDKWGFKYSTDNSNETQISDVLLNDNQWHHIAVVRDGNDLKLYRDGQLRKKHDISSATLYNSADPCRIANDGWDSPLDCHISNLRLVKGSVVYTTSFKVPTEPLSNITNTKLLCCNGTSTTSSTVTPGTITANGDPTSSTVTPFDDPKCFKFGEDGKQNIIKCGGYRGRGSKIEEVDLGFEPQWVMIKNTSQGNVHTNWHIYDSMRGVPTGGNTAILSANLTNNESGGTLNYNDKLIDFTPTGFIADPEGTDWSVNGGQNQNYVYIAIRRADGFVGKPAEAGTDVFAMDTGNGSSTIPTFDSNFVVDYALRKEPATTAEWASISRLTGDKYLVTNGTASQSSYGYFKWDSNVGVGTNFGSGVQAFMWKRHAGFDVVTYTGDSLAGRNIPHSLNKTPEMIWVKERNGDRPWQIYHKGFNGGTNPEQYYMNFDTGAEADSALRWNDTAPTSTHFTVGNSNFINDDSNNVYMAMLFASVSGISAVGSFTGNGSTGQTITLGFQPRFLMLRQVDTDAHWYILDTTRGWGSGDDKYLMLNGTNAQGDYEFGEPASNGFTLVDGGTSNTTGKPYIYYAHA